MDITTGVGLLAGIIVVAVMIFMGGDLHMFISEHAMIIIFGGSIAATLIRFPLMAIIHGLPLGAKFAFTMSRLSARDLVDELARIAEIARKQGPVGLEKVEAADPFLAKGIRFVADGYDLEFIRDNLERDRDNFLMIHHGVIGFVTLGAVFLAVTGAEALYADLGHFGKRPIQTAWLALVLPALALNYLGQGALLLSDPTAIANPFFLMFPAWALLPMVVLATLATVIASQAVITGAYSLTRQAIQLGLLPRFEIRHTSEAHSGQIYIPRVNAMLLVFVVLLVFLFRSSSALASAYGIAVTGTMVVTALMGFVVIWKVWRWSMIAAAALIAPFLFLDLTFLAANLLKVFEGGWVPLVLGALVMLLMMTWRRGSRLLFEKSRKLEFPLLDLVAMSDGCQRGQLPVAEMTCEDQRRFAIEA